MTEALGDRMKRYEDVNRMYLTPRMPLMLRIDGRAFHTFTRGMEKPFDPTLMHWMNATARAVCEEAQNAVCAFTQSDEINVLLVDFRRLESQAWFDGNLQKIVSISAAIASATMTMMADKPAHFDARAFVLPEAEVSNYFLWRQRDWERNSISMLAQSLYSHKELQGKTKSDMHELCFAKGHNWAALHSHLRAGRFICRDENGAWSVAAETPRFALDRAAVERLLVPDAD